MHGIIKMEMANKDWTDEANEPFQVFGRLIPFFQDGAWSWTEELFAEPYEKVYPPEERNLEGYIDNPQRAIYLCYQAGIRAGHIRLSMNWNQFCLIEDISVSSAYKRRGIGKQLIEQARLWALERNLPGLMLETQDVNLAACRFYQSLGFVLGGVDTMVYKNTESSGEYALFWYQIFSHVG